MHPCRKMWREEGIERMRRTVTDAGSKKKKRKREPYQYAVTWALCELLKVEAGSKKDGERMGSSNYSESYCCFVAGRYRTERTMTILSFENIDPNSALPMKKKELPVHSVCLFPGVHRDMKYRKKTSIPFTWVTLHWLGGKNLEKAQGPREDHVQRHLQPQTSSTMYVLDSYTLQRSSRHCSVGNLLEWKLLLFKFPWHGCFYMVLEPSRIFHSLYLCTKWSSVCLDTLLTINEQIKSLSATFQRITSGDKNFVTLCHIDQELLRLMIKPGVTHFLAVSSSCQTVSTCCISIVRVRIQGHLTLSHKLQVLCIQTQAISAIPGWR